MVELMDFLNSASLQAAEMQKPPDLSGLIHTLNTVFLFQGRLVLNNMNISHSIPATPEACSLPGAFTKTAFTFLWKRECMM